MSDARLCVVATGALVSFQDAGRPGNMRFGVPSSGPIDRLAHATANVAVGNEPGATAIEVSMAGLELECVDGEVTVAVTGGEFDVAVAGRAVASWSLATLGVGDRLRLRVGPSGRWAYVAVAGEYDVATWLGHTATHSMSGFGGGALRAGDEILVRQARNRRDRVGALPRPARERTAAVRVVLGPQDRHFTTDALDAFRSRRFTVTDAADRMGVRLDGPHLDTESALSIPSEPVVRGSVQVAGDGVATVLLADHQTTGGYPKIATVVSPDLDALAQLRAPAALTFTPVTPHDAVDIVRAAARLAATHLAEVAGPTLAQRLASENLVDG